jgi:hypothetical protein
VAERFGRVQNFAPTISALLKRLPFLDRPSYPVVSLPTALESGNPRTLLHFLAGRAGGVTWQRFLLIPALTPA